MMGIFMENKSVWDKIKLDQLEKLWSEGMPITKIGIELGVSRNAIAGKAHRLVYLREILQFLNQENLEKIR